MKMKKLASLFLVLMMVVGMVGSVSAEEVEKGTITIKNAVVDQTYTIYQILDLESYSLAAKAYAYKATETWKSFIESDEIKGVYVNVDAQGYVTWVADADPAAFAKAAQAWAKTNSITPSADPVTATETTVEFKNLDLGYYLVDTTLGALCSLDTTNPKVEMKEKNEAPTVTKEVQEDSDSSWDEINDADINQVVNFKATITVQNGAENYILHDTMSAGLTFDPASVKVTVSGNEITSNYEVITNVDDDCTFEVKFDNAYIATLAAGTQIVVKYSAKLNENAVVAGAGNPNEVKLQYGDSSKPSYTPVDKTITYTWDTKVIKYTMIDGTNVTLADAIFKLCTDEAGANALKFHSLGNNEYEVCADTTCDKEHMTEITTDSTGTFHIEGLDAGTYYLFETKAPNGYNKVPGSTTVIITPTESSTKEGKIFTYDTVETEVLNQSGTELPSTGGIGTTLFYIAGSILVVGALVLMITKRRVTEK